MTKKTGNNIQDSKLPEKSLPDTDVAVVVEGDTGKKQKKVTQKNKNLSSYDMNALALLKKDPTLTYFQVAKQLKDLGLSKSDRTIYTRLKKNEYLSVEIKKVRQANLELMSREVVPEAIKIHKRVLKDKAIPDKEKKDWVFQAEKVEFRMNESKPINPMNIFMQPGSQAMIANAFGIELKAPEGEMTDGAGNTILEGEKVAGIS